MWCASCVTVSPLHLAKFSAWASQLMVTLVCSGLDSFTANEVMTVVRALTSGGVTVCATIHSPSAYTFDLFDRLLVLVRGGTVRVCSSLSERADRACDEHQCIDAAFVAAVVLPHALLCCVCSCVLVHLCAFAQLMRGYLQVYFGPNGAGMIAYFTSCGVEPPQSTLNAANISNNADYLTDFVVGADREGRAADFAAAYAESELRRTMDAIIACNAEVLCCAFIACTCSSTVVCAVPAQAMLAFFFCVAICGKLS